MTRIPINQQTVRVYTSKITRDKRSAMRNVHILCSNCPPPATTQAQSLFRHSLTTLSMMRWSSLSRRVNWSCNALYTTQMLYNLTICIGYNIVCSGLCEC